MPPTPEKVSLTGSEFGTPRTHSRSVSLALGRLRKWVVICSWVIGVSIMIQVIFWALASFTALRFQDMKQFQSSRLVVQAEAPAAAEVRSAFADDPADVVPKPDAPERVRTKWDRMFAVASSFAGGVGAGAVLLFVPLVTLGVLLGVASATEGVERCVSAFGWAVLVGLLVLSFSGVISLPGEHDGGVWTYDNLTRQLESVTSSTGAVSPTSEIGVVVLSRYLMLPIACVIGVVLSAMQFSAGLEAGVLRKEDLRLDPTLEKEAANMKATSLMAGRGDAAMKSAQKKSAKANKKKKAEEDDMMPVMPLSRKQPEQGETPKRLI